MTTTSAPYAPTRPQREAVTAQLEVTEQVVVHHFGPHTSDPGGMETVIRTHVDFLVGADDAKAHATKRLGQPTATLGHALSSACAVLLLPRDAVAHFHVSERGSFVREGILIALARLRGLPIVVTNHGSQFVSFASDRPWLVGPVLRMADAVLCLSDEAMDTSQRLAPNADIFRTCNPVPIDDASPPADNTPAVALFAGAVGTRKGVDTLIDAWHQVAKARPEATLVVAGPLEDIEVPTDPQIRMLGPVPHDRVLELIRGSRLVVLASRSEAMPMVLTEALAAGRPFVSTDIAGIPELANGEQALVAVDDVEALADELERLLENPHLARSRGDAGQRFHRSTRSIEALQPRLRGVYEHAIARSAGRRTTKLLWRRKASRRGSAL